MKRFYWLVNKPWIALPVVLRAIKFGRHRRRLDSEEHCIWAERLAAEARLGTLCPNTFSFAGLQEHKLPYKVQSHKGGTIAIADDSYFTSAGSPGHRPNGYEFLDDPDWLAARQMVRHTEQ